VTASSSLYVSEDRPAKHTDISYNPHHREDKPHPLSSAPSIIKLPLLCSTSYISILSTVEYLSTTKTQWRTRSSSLMLRIPTPGMLHPTFLCAATRKNAGSRVPPPCTQLPEDSQLLKLHGPSSSAALRNFRRIQADPHAPAVRWSSRTTPS
jgi:hypothetical protein